jgi:hypothetical protein
VKKVVYLPLDERPCNLAFVKEITRDNAAFRLVAPELCEMGNKKTPARYEDVRSFLERECLDADYLIIAIDTLLYGGIIPSRLHNSELGELVGRLGLLRSLKERNKNLYVSAFSLVMRCPCYSDSSEEPDYYAECGREIFLYGQNEHKLKIGMITSEEYEKTRVSLGACEAFIEDYTLRRAKNLECLTEVIRMMGEVINDFTILQDDSNEYGYTAMDRERVLAMASELGVKVDVYPGADEGGLVMLSRVATYIDGKRPRICPIFPRVGAEDVVPIYEDRAIKKTLLSQIKSAGATLCESPDDADVLLFCNLNDERTYDVYLDYTVQSDESYHSSFAARIMKSLEQGKGVAIADVAYCNAGDHAFMHELGKKIDLLKLWGYAGWNTASNTLGTVICQSVLRYLYGDTPTHRRFTALRILDDVVYSADVRRELSASGDNDCDTIVRMVNEHTRVSFSGIYERYMAVDCYLPWNRLFEIGLTVKERLYET